MLMKHKVTDWLLALSILLGFLMAWQSGRERSRLQDKYQQLHRIVGELLIADPSQVHVRALETREPLHFAWRISLPANYTLQLSDKGGSQGPSSSTGSREFIARVRFREDEQGGLQVYQNFLGSSVTHRFADQSLAAFLRDRWGKIIVEQLGADRLVTIAPDRSAVLLRLTLPEGMQREARTMLSPHSASVYVPVVYELKLGADTPKP